MNFLQNLEYFPANIFKSHGRNFVGCIFMRWGPDQGNDTPSNEFVVTKEDAIRARWFISSIWDKLTPHQKQADDTKLYKSTRGDHQTFVRSLFLTYRGYKVLGLEDRDIPKDRPPSEPIDVDFFRLRMLDIRVRDYFHDYQADSAFDDAVDATYQGPIDAMLLVAHDCKHCLDRELSAITSSPSFQEVALDTFIERGETPGKINGFGVGPLGFADDISNEQDPQMIWNHTSLLEPFSKNRGWKSYGSFLAFRKLEVNLGHFDQMVNDLSKAIVSPFTTNPKQQRDLAAALYMGRFRNGMPVTLSPLATDPTDGQLQNFDYSIDSAGLKCPFHSHIRAMNTRNGGIGQSANIIRRSIGYSENRSNPENGQQYLASGLLFMSYQSSIHKLVRLFDQMEKRNDTVVYRPRQEVIEKVQFQKIYATNGETIELPIGGRNLTIYRGGESFFAPSLFFLREVINVPIVI